MGLISVGATLYRTITRDYTYDFADRMIGEDVNVIGEGNTPIPNESFEVAYTLDLAGNRRRMVRDPDASPINETTTYQYDARHRLTSEELSGVHAITYDYDANGAMTLRTQDNVASPDVTQRSYYDPRGRVVAMGVG